MGVTVSRSTTSPLSMVSTVIGFVSFFFTLATLLKVFWSNLGTYSAAPKEIPDYLSLTKQGLLEERRHLRRSRRRLKSVRRDRSHGPGARIGSDDHSGGYGDRKKSNEHRGHRSGKRGQMHFDRDIQSLRSEGEDEALKAMRMTIRDLIKAFRNIEQPFLKPEYQSQDSAHWSTGNYPQDKSPYSPNYPHSDDDSPSAQHMQSSNRLGHEYKTCGFKERYLWVRRKSAVVNLSQSLSRVEGRRTAHEVGEVFGMVSNIGRDLEDMHDSIHALEGRLNRVVGVRRVD